MSSSTSVEHGMAILISSVYKIVKNYCLLSFENGMANV